MKFLWRVIKSLDRKEKIIVVVLLLVFLGSSYSLFFSDQKVEFGAKTYTEGIVGEIKHLNPVFTEFSEADTDVCSLIFSGLARYDAATDSFKEDIATHTLSVDKLTYTFTLKNNVYWHDGTEVTAEDIYFTFAEVIQSDGFNNPVLKSNFEGVDIELVDTRTVTFTLNTVNSFFFSGMTVGLLPKHILGEVPISELDTHDFNKNPIGTGPYMVSSPYEILPDGSTSVNLTANTNFYGEAPGIENFRFVAYPNSELLAENRSSWNGAARIRQSQLDEMEDLDKLISYQYELPQYTALFLNTDAENLLSTIGRLGVSKAIDKAEILEAIDYKVQIDTPLLELSQDEWLHVPALEEAQGAFKEAGFSLIEGDIYRTNEDGETLTLRLLRRDFTGTNELQEETMSMTAHIIQEQLADAGAEVIIEAYSMEELQGKIQNRDYDMLLYGQSLGYNLDTFSYWHSSQVSEEVLTEFQSKFDVDAGYTVEYGGELEEMMESFGSLGRSMLFGILLIIVILILQFNSYRQVAMIIFTIPLALIGVFSGLTLVGLPFSFPAFVGVVALAGIVVNNAIILIDRINKNVKSGMPKKEAAIEAGIARFQPILLTSITTIVGILPLAISDPTWGPLGFTIISGLAFSTILTLIVVPSTYVKFSK
jgi:ABC-type transport system substrate-binding protein